MCVLLPSTSTWRAVLARRRGKTGLDLDRPDIVEIDAAAAVVWEETIAPIL
jgi:hypothetical protein